MKRLLILSTLLIVFLCGCSLQEYNRKYRPQLINASVDPLAHNLLYHDHSVSLYKGRWPDFRKFRMFLTKAVPDHAMNKGQNPKDAVEKARSTNSMAVRVMEESDQGQYCFYHLEFSARKPIEISGPGALEFSFQSDDGDTITVSDHGLIFARSGKRFLQWRSDTVNGGVKLNRDYSSWNKSGHGPQHCYVRLPAQVRDMDIISIRPNPERWISSSSLVATTR